ncbi:MAG: terminase small subunit [Streptococcus lutetiensis]|uniref:terminase small subunit n=1 Tax=Streptococcus lutetiensis TaxID=150055 RepID=UPI000DBE4000|nr:terminase small subunit [Streptococcus lutetiensis]MBT0938739.1 terminase small subunit [Streptococcus lutetiensis]QQE31618.1 terminase small subunit [Streptococcus lutetiensis]HEP3064038.1 terminase small subunit [Streptococcus pyogenes]
MAKLTIKQQRFADEYIISANATQAAIKAGYSKKYANTNASKLLQNTTIKSYIDERLAELQSQKVADQQEVLEYLTSVMRGQETEQTIIGVADLGQELTDIEVSAKDRIKAAELLGKRYRMWTDKVEAEVQGTVVFANEDDIAD